VHVSIPFGKPAWPVSLVDPAVVGVLEPPAGAEVVGTPAAVDRLVRAQGVPLGAPDGTRWSPAVLPTGTATRAAQALAR
jgi:hypothetical protein